MKKPFLTLLFLFILNVSFGQCFFGFEHINTQSGDSAVVIKKYGFPNYTEFRIFQCQNLDGSLVTVDTTITSQINDTLLFSSQADSIGWLYICGVSSAGDTLGFFKSELSRGYPVNIGVTSYTPPTSISSSDGVVEFYDLAFSSGGFYHVNGNGLEYLFDSLPAGILEGMYKYADDSSMYTDWSFQAIVGNPEDWVDVQSGTMTCPIGINLATNQSTCDGEAYVGQVQNGVAPYTYDWNGTGTFGTDTTITGLCVGNNYVTIQDQNGDIRTCAFAMGSGDSGYFPPTQTSDTTIHTFTDYCIDPDVDSISVIGSEIIDSVSASVVWTFYDGSVLVDQFLDTFHFTIPNGNYNSIELQLHLVCNGDTLKSTSSVYSTYGYVSLPFSEIGYLGLQEWGSKDEVNLYPIPFDNFINIDLNTSEIEEILVLNQLGQKEQVDFNKLSENHLIADFSGLNKGIYIIHFLSLKGEVTIKKVLKN